MWHCNLLSLDFLIFIVNSLFLNLREEGQRPKRGNPEKSLLLSLCSVHKAIK